MLGNVEYSWLCKALRLTQTSSAGTTETVLSSNNNHSITGYNNLAIIPGFVKDGGSY